MKMRNLMRTEHESFDEKALVEEEPSDNDLAEEELLSQGATQRVLDATQLYLGEIGYSPLLTAEEEVYFARRALRGDVASRRRMIESNLRLVVKIAPSLRQSWSGSAGSD
jgi:RNA polymerase nonessential primary-like sigma factor